MKLISIVTPTYNEEANVPIIYQEVKKIFKELPKYNYEHIFIDNASTDRTVPILKSLAKKDKHLKIIVNSRNFGWIRSPFYGMLKSKGDAVVLLVADLQDPPSLIKTFINKWEQGYKVAIGIKNKSEEHFITNIIRKSYYQFLSKISEIDLINNFMGFGLYDKKIIAELRKMEDSYPYFRGLVSEMGFDIAKIEYKQLNRKGGIAKSSLYKLLDVAVLGITTYSRFPLRMVTILGLFLSFLSLLGGLVFISLTVIFGKWSQLGGTILISSFFLFASLQFLFIGIIGEYIGIIHTRVLKRPLVIEKERVNF